MKGKSSFATFALTTAMLGLLIGLSLRSGNAQAGSSSAVSQAFLGGASIGRDDVASVAVFNPSSDPTSPAIRVAVSFLNTDGAQLKAGTCDLRASQSCFVSLTFAECGVANARGGCDFTAVATPEPVTAPPTTDGGVVGGTASFTANLEVQSRAGRFEGVGSPVPAFSIPIIPGTTGSDGGVF